MIFFSPWALLLTLGCILSFIFPPCFCIYDSAFTYSKKDEESYAEYY